MIKKIIAIGLIAVSSFGAKVEISREIVTNKTPPSVICITSCIATNNYCLTNIYFSRFESNIYFNRFESEFKKEADLLRKEIQQLTYPKYSAEYFYVWSNTVYSVKEKGLPDFVFTNSVCLKSLFFEKTISQQIVTNTTITTNWIEK